MHTRGGVLVATVIVGLAFGFTIVNIGFADYTQLIRMFTFQDLRMLYAFAAAVLVIMVAFGLLRVRRTPVRMHAGVVPGAVLFGAGWAISGGCPAVPLVQVASGYLPALVTIAGIIAGMWMYRWANVRYLHLAQGSCGV